MKITALNRNIFAFLSLKDSDLAEVKPAENKLMGETEVGSMTKWEKQAYTQLQNKTSEYESEHARIYELKNGGKKVKGSEAENLCLLEAEINGLQHMLSSSVRTRIHDATHADIIEFRPGYKIVTGTSQEFEIRRMLSSPFLIIGTHFSF